MTGQARLAQVARHMGTKTPSATAAVAKPPTFRDRSNYKYFLPIQSRWSDNDNYGHINNSIYYFYIDTVVNEYLIRNCGLDPNDTTKTRPIGLVIASSANFYAPASYPNLLHAGLSITKIGRSSVTYRVGIFEGDKQEASMVGGFTHVFVDPIHRRPVSALPESMKSGMLTLLVEQAADDEGKKAKQ
ncbi:HotDog domain-containing protein [Zychaea mexicana]|uniref:HotDog domain-containing protein n=1 Tax=Zychaea mexicana TaxID=64656 RepID=UPI0022FEBC8C|nr:HotDog domain-containing protein [Zychaea mexicana]KAI9497089.1 HotDog domain-containing protein [Zychaea mexicana]